ncbi:hypothetical protein EDB85DRAFT_1889245 [Lactarius pseudohatsudake]|nr:hypothetical protein EDB85DRAFT_1889245 [Lactarius pseudohatsudake]
MVLGKVKETTRAYLGKGTVMVVACLFNTEHQVTKDTGTLQAFRSSTLSTTLQQLPSPMDLTRLPIHTSPPSISLDLIILDPTLLQAFRSSALATSLWQPPSPMDLTRLPSLQILCITNKPRAATVAQGLDKRMKLWERNMMSALIRPMGWHRESRLKRWGGHLTVDFCKENGVHVTTHHVYPTEVAYRWR